nr:MAG: replication associated protein [Cressdnaviricota sp.]
MSEQADKQFSADKLPKKKVTSARHRNYFNTQNNPTDDFFAMLHSLECRYIAYSKEIAPTTKMFHVHYYISFTNAKTWTAVQKMFPHSDIRIQRGSFGECQTYVTKSNGGKLDYERGDCPLTNENQIKSQKERFADALTLAKAGKFQDIDPELMTRYHSFYSKVSERHGHNPYGDLDLPDRQRLWNYWIYGPTGTGKTKGTIDYFGKPNVFKVGPADRFWSLYYSQRKKGMDHRMVRPEIVVVTSNYCIEDIWGLDQLNTQEAMLRRFTQVHKDALDVEVDFT